MLGYVPPSKTLTAAVLKDLGFGGGPKRGPQASRTPHTLPPGSEKGLNKFRIRESYDQHFYLVTGNWLADKDIFTAFNLTDWRTSLQRTTLQNQLWDSSVQGKGFEDYDPVAGEIRRQVYRTGLENKAKKDVMAQRTKVRN